MSGKTAIVGAFGNERPASAERCLWLAVIRQAIRDASTAGKRQSGESLKHTKLYRSRASAWFGTADFSEVCNFAGIDPAFAKRKLVPVFDPSKVGGGA